MLTFLDDSLERAILGASLLTFSALSACQSTPGVAPATASPAPELASAAPAPAQSASAVAEAMSAPSPATKPASSGDTLWIAAVGDSLTDPKSHGGGYLDVLRKHCPAARIDNFGRGGFMVNQMRRRFESDVLTAPAHYTHLIVFGGVNDLYSDLTALRTPAKIEADLSYMYGAARARGMKVVAFSVAPWGGFTRYFNESRAAATHALNAWIGQERAAGQIDAWVDAFALLSCGDADVLCERYAPPFHDGIHFGRAGHQILGEALIQAAFRDCR